MNAPTAKASFSVNREVRRPVQLSGFAIVEGRQTVDVTVLNLTYDGCCVETASALTPGQAVKLSVLGRGAVDAEVRWSNHRHAGLRFSPLPEPPAEQTPRIEERIEIDAEVLQRRQGHANYRVRLFDISCNGCKAEFVERPRVGDSIWIKFDGLESLDAEVCWADGFNAGLKFVNPIHPAVFELLLKRLGETA